MLTSCGLTHDDVAGSLALDFERIAIPRRGADLTIADARVDVANDHVIAAQTQRGVFEAYPAAGSGLASDGHERV
jgi:hypothetical protein